MVRIFRQVEEKYLKHLNLDAGRAKKPGIANGIPVMR